MITVDDLGDGVREARELAHELLASIGLGCPWSKCGEHDGELIRLRAARDREGT